MASSFMTANKAAIPWKYDQGFTNLKGESFNCDSQSYTGLEEGATSKKLFQISCWTDTGIPHLSPANSYMPVPWQIWGLGFAGFFIHRNFKHLHSSKMSLMSRHSLILASKQRISSRTSLRYDLFSHVKNWQPHTDHLQQVGVFSIIQDPIRQT